MALFATGHPDYFYAAPLPAPPDDEVSWDALPMIAPLQAILDDFERIAVALVDKERSRLFSIFLGEVEERQEFEDEVPGKQATGDWFALAQTRYARHHEDHVLRHIKRTTAALMTMLCARPFDRLLLAGPAEALALLRRHLPGPLRARFAGTLALEMFAGEAAILQAAREAAEQIERQAEVDAANELLDTAGTSHGVLGLDATLAALDAGRVHRLLLAETFRHPGSVCPDCGRLTVERERCPHCHAFLRPLPNLRERLVERAAEQGAFVEFVAGPAAERLEKFGGLGAWTRF